MSFILLGILNAQAAGGGGAGAYDLLETQILSSSASSVTFTGLDSYSDYKHLQIRWVVKSSKASTGDAMVVYVNGDTSTSNYSAHVLRGSGSSVSSAGYTGQGRIELANIIANSADSNNFGAGVTDILDFSSTSKNKTFRSINGNTTSSQQIEFRSGLWVSTSAITSIEFNQETGPNFVTGSRFSLYGIKGE